jgi:hypothetical protein
MPGEPGMVDSLVIEDYRSLVNDVGVVDSLEARHDFGG